MDEDWHRLIEKIHRIIPELKENEFTKPSGKKNITEWLPLYRHLNRI